MAQIPGKWIANDAIDQTKVDWGSGAGQVDSTEVPADTSFSPANYTRSGSFNTADALASITSDLAGIDAELGSGGGSWSLAASGSAYVSEIGNDTTGNGSPSAPWATVRKALAEAALVGGGATYLGAGDPIFTIYCSGTITETVTYGATTGAGTHDIQSLSNYQIIGDGITSTVITHDRTTAAPFFDFSYQSGDAPSNILFQDLTIYDPRENGADRKAVLWNPDTSVTVTNVHFERVRFKGREGSEGILRVGDAAVDNTPTYTDTTLFRDIEIEFGDEPATLPSEIYGIRISTSSPIVFDGVSFINLGWPGSSNAVDVYGVFNDLGIAIWTGIMRRLRGDVSVSTTGVKSVYNMGFISAGQGFTLLEDVNLHVTCTTNVGSIIACSGEQIRDAFVTVNRTITTATGGQTIAILVPNGNSERLLGEVNLQVDSAIVNCERETAGVVMLGGIIGDVTGRLIMDTNAVDFSQDPDTGYCAAVVVDNVGFVLDLNIQTAKCFLEFLHAAATTITGVDACHWKEDDPTTPSGITTRTTVANIDCFIMNITGNLTDVAGLSGTGTFDGITRNEEPMVIGAGSITRQSAGGTMTGVFPIRRRGTLTTDEFEIITGVDALAYNNFTAVDANVTVSRDDSGTI